MHKVVDYVGLAGLLLYILRFPLIIKVSAHTNFILGFSLKGFKSVLLGFTPMFFVV